MEWFIDGRSHVKELGQSAGGKAKNLGLMEQNGLAVPPWVALRKEAFTQFLVLNGFTHTKLQVEATKDSEERIQELFSRADLPASLSHELRNILESRPQFSADVAVRSSGLEEDGAKHSFAGQFSSFLFQKGQAEIERSIKLCWASAYSERALRYRIEQGLDCQKIEMGVVLQQMVDAEVAGVLFTKHPIKLLDRHLILVSAVFGAGEGLVSGVLPADHFELRLTDKSISKEIVEKTVRLGRDPNGGLCSFPVPTAEQKSASLTDSELLALGDLARKLEDFGAGPQDAEFVLDQERRIFVVQTRPITTLPVDAFFDENINGGSPKLWDNSNIIESYSGVTTPLTFSFASRAYNQVYIQFFEVMGVPKYFAETQSSIFRNLLGLIRGRIYYNLMNWYQLVLALPGTKSNQSFMETMMGVKQGLDPSLQKMFAELAEPPQYSFLAKLGLLGKTVFRFVRIDSIIRDFFSGFNATYEEAKAKNFKHMSLPDLLDYYYSLEERFLKRWKAPIINDYLCMVFFGLLKKLSAKWLDANVSESLQNDLLCGEGGLDSTEPTKFLMRLAKSIDTGDAAYRHWFLHTDPQIIQQSWLKPTNTHEVATGFRQFIDLFGFRCVNELKLEEKDFHDDPSFVITSLISYVKTKSYDIAAMEIREKKIRSEAEALLKAQLKAWRRFVYGFILKQARRAVKNRENLRFARTKSFGITRHLFRAMGQRLYQLEFLSDPNDVFYLTIEELMAFIEGRVVSMRLKETAMARRLEYDAYKKTPSPPERFITLGAVGATVKEWKILAESDLLRSSCDTGNPKLLKGTACCPGIVEGIVRVVDSPQDAEGLSGEILVTARTDPGWVPLFPSCSGLLIERGSLLSHSAVVARELGLPTIVGIQGGLLQKLKTGDRVRMDAGKGIVEIL